MRASTSAMTSGESGYEGAVERLLGFEDLFHLFGEVNGIEYGRCHPFAEVCNAHAQFLKDIAHACPLTYGLGRPPERLAKPQKGKGTAKSRAFLSFPLYLNYRETGKFTCKFKLLK